MTTTVTTTEVTAAPGKSPVTGHAAGHTHAHGRDHHDHVHGEMNVKEHERTFDGFVHFMTWNVVAITVVLVFLALANS